MDIQNDERLLLRVIMLAMVAGHAGLAASILAGGNERFPFPTYRPLLDLTGGQAWPWGIAIGVSALLMVMPSRILAVLGAGVGLAWMNMFSAMFIVSVVRYPASGSTAPFPYAELSIIYVGVLIILVRDLVRERRVRRGSLGRDK